MGNEDYKPTIADLEIWREVFKEAQEDKDFMIFTHPAVDVSILPMSIESIIEVEAASPEEKLNHMEELIVNQIK